MKLWRGEERRFPYLELLNNDWAVIRAGGEFLLAIVSGLMAVELISKHIS